MAVVVRSIPKRAKTRNEGGEEEEGGVGRVCRCPAALSLGGVRCRRRRRHRASPFTLCRRVAARCRTPRHTHAHVRHSRGDGRASASDTTSRRPCAVGVPGKCHFGTLDLVRLPPSARTDRARFRPRALGTATSTRIGSLGRLPDERVLEGKGLPSLAVPPTCPVVVLSRMTTLLFLAPRREPR